MFCFQAQIYRFTNLRQKGKGRRMELERSGFKLPTLLLTGYICYSKQGSKQGSYAFLNCCIISTILYQLQVNNIVTSSIKSYYKIMIIILYAIQCIFTTYLFYTEQFVSSGTSLVAQTVKHLLQCGRPGFNAGMERSPGEDNGTPLQDSCLENPTDGGDGEVTVQRVGKSQTRLSDFTFTYFCILEVGNGQYSCLENPMDRGGWQATVHEVGQSWT